MTHDDTIPFNSYDKAIECLKSFPFKNYSGFYTIGLKTLSMVEDYRAFCENSGILLEDAYGYGKKAEVLYRYDRGEYKFENPFDLTHIQSIDFFVCFTYVHSDDGEIYGTSYTIKAQY
jgi:hypothetical protein